MSIEKIICDFCEKEVPNKVDCNPTWFGKYRKEKLIKVICKDCIKNNLEKWRKVI